MAFLPLAILALVQGITEFLPISSSAHLLLARDAMVGVGLQGHALSQHQELALDVAVHLGTLAAVTLYFWRDVAVVVGGCFDVVARRRTGAGRLALHLAIASLPVAIAGFFAKDLIENLLRGDRLVVSVIALATIGFAVLLYLGDRIGARLPDGHAKRLDTMSPGHALWIGLAQVFALIPGTSRAGVTISAARFFGYDRTEAARFSFLLSVPAILGAGMLLGLDIVEAGDVAFGIDAAVAMGLAFAAAFVSIALLMRWLTHAGFTPFVVYRLILGAGLLAWVLLG